MTASVVQKFGGTSVADIARVQAVAKKVAVETRAGRQVAVVVSAMAGVTNQLVDYTRQIAAATHTNYHDVVLSSGEQITTGLLALALNQIGVKAEPLMGWQIPILTDGHHTNASIQEVKPERLQQAWAAGVVPVVAGFQGISPEGRITTLGRGGSDTTAVALAASLKADTCDIYTDVDGVYTADPRIVPCAHKLDLITYDEMIELASCGAKVLHWRSVQTAKDYQVDLRVFSSFVVGSGTHIVATRPIDEDTCVSGIVLSTGDVRLTLKGMQRTPQWQAELMQLLQAHQIPTDMMTYQPMNDRQVNVSFVVPEGEVARTIALLESYPVDVDRSLARVAVVGYGIASHLGIAGAVFQVLAAHGIAIHAVTTSPIKISVLVERDQAERAIRLLHTAYGLDRG